MVAPSFRCVRSAPRSDVRPSRLKTAGVQSNGEARGPCSGGPTIIQLASACNRQPAGMAPGSGSDQSLPAEVCGTTPRLLGRIAAVSRAAVGVASGPSRSRSRPRRCAGRDRRAGRGSAPVRDDDERPGAELMHATSPTIPSRCPATPPRGVVVEIHTSFISRIGPELLVRVRHRAGLVFPDRGGHQAVPVAMSPGIGRPVVQAGQARRLRIPQSRLGVAAGPQRVDRSHAPDLCELLLALDHRSLHPCPHDRPPRMSGHRLPDAIAVIRLGGCMRELVGARARGGWVDHPHEPLRDRLRSPFGGVSRTADSQPWPKGGRHEQTGQGSVADLAAEGLAGAGDGRGDTLPSSLRLCGCPARVGPVLLQSFHAPSRSAQTCVTSACLNADFGAGDRQGESAAILVLMGTPRSNNGSRGSVGRPLWRTYATIQSMMNRLQSSRYFRRTQPGSISQVARPVVPLFPGTGSVWFVAHHASRQTRHSRREREIGLPFMMVQRPAPGPAARRCPAPPGARGSAPRGPGSPR